MEKFMQNANADGTPKILYTGVAKISMSMRSQADKDSASLGLLKEGEAVQIFGYDQEWLFCWRSDVGIYYVGRHNVDDILPVSDDVAPTALFETAIWPLPRWKPPCTPRRTQIPSSSSPSRRIPA
ncbi:MAG: hypothetical protein ACLUHE_16510 [Christensenellales bacterium]